ncbi:MAG: hypothetical protein LBR90_02045 [Elusimicrobiota bacterium]|jgi:hypothetical protein|nr:hypothetical protein [Elusimicrobiota bacterium]
MSKTNTGAGKVFLSPAYLLAQAFTLAIFFIGLKWTMLGIYWLPYIFNPFIYLCILLSWFYYNFLWLRTALYLPTAMLFVSRAYDAVGVKLPLWRVFYVALCKLQRLRREDVKIKRSGALVRFLARGFMKHGIILNFPRPRAEEISIALFIHRKRKVIEMFKVLAPYLLPAFIAVLILTPGVLFLSSFNYRYVIESQPALSAFASFWLYLVTLPFSLTWIFLMLNLLAVNILSPLFFLPSAKMYGDFLKENKEPVNFNKPQRPSAEAVLALLMTAASASFYFSMLAAKYAAAAAG